MHMETVVLYSTVARHLSMRNSTGLMIRLHSVDSVCSACGQERNRTENRYELRCSTIDVGNVAVV